MYPPIHVRAHVCTHIQQTHLKKWRFRLGRSLSKHPGSSSATGTEKQSLSSQGSSGIQQHTLPSPLHPNKGRGHPENELGRQTPSPSGAWARARFQKLSRKTKKIQSGNHHVGAHGHLHSVLPACSPGPQPVAEVRIPGHMGAITAQQGRETCSRPHRKIFLLSAERTNVWMKEGTGEPVNEGMNDCPVGGLWLSWVSSRRAAEDRRPLPSDPRPRGGARQPLLKAGRGPSGTMDLLCVGGWARNGARSASWSGPALWEAT